MQRAFRYLTASARRLWILSLSEVLLFSAVSAAAGQICMSANRQARALDLSYFDAKFDAYFRATRDLFTVLVALSTVTMACNAFVFVLGVIAKGRARDAGLDLPDVTVPMLVPMFAMLFILRGYWSTTTANIDTAIACASFVLLLIVSLAGRRKAAA